MQSAAAGVSCTGKDFVKVFFELLKDYYELQGYLIINASEYLEHYIYICKSVKQLILLLRFTF
jgi:hypothetical protein